MFGAASKFMNSPLGLLLAKAGLDFGAGALSDPGYQPFQFSELEGEKGRLLKPENAAYNSMRSILGLGMGVGRKLNQPQSFQMPGGVPSVKVPGMPFDFGGMQGGGSINIPGMDFSINGEDQLSGYFEKLLKPAVPDDILGQPATSTRRGGTNRLRGGR